MRNTILKWTLLTLLVGYTVWVTVWANREADRHKCAGVIVKVVGTENPTIRERTKTGILAELKSYPNPLSGVPVHSVNTADVESYLSAISNFESVDCMIDADNRLLIEAKPLEPVMRVFDGTKSYYINRQGKRIEARAEFFTDVPVVSGNFNKSFKPEDVLPLVRYIGSDPKLSNLTGMVLARDARNLIIVPRVRGHVVNFGDTNRLAEKSHDLFLFYRKVMAGKNWMDYDTISVKFSGQVVATRRDKTKLQHAEEFSEDFDPEEHTLPDVAELGHTN